MRTLIIFIYGALVTLGILALVGFGNSFTGFGDGFTVAHRISKWIMVPLVLYFLILAACGRAIEKNEKRSGLFLAHFIVVGGLLITAGLFNGIILCIVTVIASTPIIVIASAPPTSE